MERRIDTKGIKDIQLDILIELHKFCEDNSIHYSLSSGTLIGAIRHKGYIPWDDDIDVCLTRDNYDRLEKLFPALLSNKYNFLTLNRDKAWNRAYGKITDTRTTLVESIRYNVASQGVGIDVFPVDDVKDCEKSLWNYLRKALNLSWNLKQIYLDKERGIIKNIILVLSRLLLFPISTRTIAVMIDNFVKGKNGKGYNHSLESSFCIWEHSFLKSDFQDYIDVAFEGHTFKAMAGYDDYLKSYYGDYMQLPPVEKRISTHSFKANWK